MLLADFKSLSTITESARFLRAEHLADKTPRTLLLGVNAESCSVHLYLDIDGLHLLCYDQALVQKQHCREQDGIELNLFHASTLRLTPAACDFECCKMLVARGVPLSWAPWRALEAAKGTSFYGCRTGDLVTGYTDADFELIALPFEELLDNSMLIRRPGYVPAHRAQLVEALRWTGTAYLRASIPTLPGYTPYSAAQVLRALPRMLRIQNMDEATTRGLSELTDKFKALLAPKLAALIARQPAT